MLNPLFSLALLRRKLRSRLALLCLVLLGGTVLAVTLIFRGESAAFPILPPGAYVGQITGVGGEGSSHTLYIERFRESDSVLILVFVDQFTPQIVVGNRIDSEGKSSGVKSLYRPLQFSFQSAQFQLQGFSDPRGVHGTLKSDGTDRGVWDLHRVGAEELGVEFRADELQLLERVVHQRSKVWESDELLKAKISEQSALQLKVDKLRDSLENNSSLVEKAKEQKQQLTDELQRAILKRKGVAETVGKLVDELETLQRITKRGNAITLARRVAHRENKWYGANWGSEDGVLSGGPLESSTDFDAEKVSDAVRRAQEISSLVHERERERQIIESLEVRLRDRATEYQGEGVVEAEPMPNVPMPKQGGAETSKEGSIWNDIF